MANERNESGDGAVGSRERRCARAWWLVAGLLIAAFLARGPLYLSVFPPFEGWDEYQHLGYIAYLDQARRIPVFGESTRVPRAVRPLAMPCPPLSGPSNSTEWGAVYAMGRAVTRSPPRRQSSASPRLCQARQPRSPTSWRCPSGAR
jgi:hypothetical protein